MRWNQKQFISEGATTAWATSKKRGFYNGLTEKRRRWREADAAFYIEKNNGKVYRDEV